MAVIPVSQIASYAYAAGFRGNSLTTAIAICLAESGGNTSAVNHNTNGTTDYGLWQINSVHSQYNGTLLLSNPAYNAQAAWELSSHGINWQPWTTFNTGAYKKFLSQAQAATGGIVQQNAQTSPSPTVDQVFDSKGLWKWYSSRVTNPFDGVYEKGADYGAAWGTPVGCIIGGRVVRIVHNNNSIGDVVEVQSADTSVVLYQHIRTKVAQGQAVSTGDVIGTEDGLPVDQYSTGPHIECRYCPAGRWNQGIDSWVEPWVNPVPLFSSIGTRLATGPNVGLGVVGLPGAAGPYVPLTYTTLTSQVHNTLVNTPGFYGIALAIDEAEQFPGWVNLTEQTSTGLPDFVGLARSIGATVSDNFTPFIIRAGLVTLGLGLELLLILKPIQAGIEVVEGS